jgi:hypothetical protein
MEGTKVIRGESRGSEICLLNRAKVQKVLFGVEHNKDLYVGALLFDDSVFCSQICACLQQHLGRSIKQIGDLEVSFTL